MAAIGRLRSHKRVRDVIWAGELLKVVRDDTHILILGDGPQRQALERFRDHVEIRDRVHFLGHRNDIDQILEHLDVLWLASAYEGFPNVILEAMVAGIPVVATDIPGNRDLVVHEKTGYLFPVGDRAALASWTNQLLDHSERARSMGEAGADGIERPTLCGNPGAAACGNLSPTAAMSYACHVETIRIGIPAGRLRNSFFCNGIRCTQLNEY